MNKMSSFYLLEHFLALSRGLGVRAVAVLAELHALVRRLLVAGPVALTNGLRCVDQHIVDLQSDSLLRGQSALSQELFEQRKREQV